MPRVKQTPFTKGEVIGFLKRFLKEESYDFKTQSIFFYKIYKMYPYEKFWRQYDLGFMLNDMRFFLSEEGKEKLETDIALFNLDLSPKDSYNIEKDKVDKDINIIHKPKTVSDLLKE